MEQPDTPPAIFGDLLRTCRKRAKLTQQQLATVLSVHLNTVWSWERGEHLPDTRGRILELAKALRLSTQDTQRLLEASLLAVGPSLGIPIGRLPAHPPVRDPLLPPAPVTGLIGRDGLLAHLIARLTSGATLALSAVQGLPGVGKTTLALALAHAPEVRSHFADGLLWAGLGQTPRIPETLARWGSLLGLTPEHAARLSSMQSWAEALRTAIGERRLLLVLDDAWQLDDVLACLVGGEGCATLITTRRPDLALQVAGVDCLAVPELSPAEGLTLLKRLAPQVVEAEPEAARDLVEAVGGLPLGLMLLGKHLQLHSYGGQPRRIQAALERLKHRSERLHIAQAQVPAAPHPSLPAGTPLSLEASIGLSVAALDAPAQAMLQALAVFPPKPMSFPEEAALRVAEGSPETLDALVDAGLVESTGQGRYALHQTIADCARLTHHDATPSRRLAEFFAHYVEIHHTDYALLAQECGTILAALQAAFDQNMPAPLVQGVRAFAPFLLMRGDYTTAEACLTRAQQAARAAGQLGDLATVQLYLGRLAEKRGDYPLAEAALQDGLTLARQLGQDQTLSALLQTLGQVKAKRGDPEQAERSYQESLRLATQSGDQEMISLLLRNLGGVAHKRGEVAQAARLYEQALDLARQVGRQEHILVLLTNLGVVALTQGNLVQAEAYLQEGLVLSRQIRDRENTCRLLTNLGVVATQRAEHAQAEVYQQEALDLARQIGHREMMAVLLTNLGDLAGKREDDAQAQALFQEGLSLARQLNHRYLISYTLEEWGELHMRQGHLDQANAAFSEALAIARQVQGQEVLALALYGLACCARAQGDLASALQQGQESLRLLEAIGHARAAEVQQWLASLPIFVNGHITKRAE